MAVAYPSVEIAKREEVESELHGEKVHDPYRWLEDVDSEDTKKWVQAQVKLTDAYLKTHCEPLVEKFKERLNSVWNYPRTSCPFKRGSTYYFWHNEGLQNQSVLYGQKDLKAEPFTVLDPNVMEEDGTAAVRTTIFSECGRYMAYAVSRSGSDWLNIHVMDVEKIEDLSDSLEWVKFSSIAWTHDGKGFFYCRYAKPAAFSDDDKEFNRGKEVDKAKNQKVYYHVLGSPQSDDVCVWSDDEHPDYMFGVEVSDCGHKLVMSVSESCDPSNLVFWADLDKFDPSSPKSLEIVKLVDTFHAEFSYITNEEDVFFFRTNLDAPRSRIVRTNITQTAEGGPEWTEILPETSDVLEYAVACGGDKMIVAFLHDVKSVASVHDLSGKKLKDIEFPELGQVVEIQSRKKLSEVFYKFQSFVQPGTAFRLDTDKLTSEIFKETRVPGIDPSLFKTEQVFFSSKDGTRVPMFIISRKDRVEGTPSPTVLYGYGGFNISLAPSFSVLRLVLVQHLGGVYAIANIRGGGEYGKEWHQAGTKTQKQNVFDDFQCAAEHLIEKKYTVPAKLAITGGSNGGLLVAACVNQRPDLYACAIAHVGVMDMLRFHRFTIGYAWCSDYGNADTNEEEFRALLKYSPLHNVGNNNSEYPAVLLCTADHDDRVVPLHSFKLAATLQHIVGSKDYQKNPLLIRIDVKAGHGAGKPLSKTIDEKADVFAFLAHSLGAEYSQ